MTTVIGVPKESKVLEHRVGLIPSSVNLLIQQGHVVNVASGAGIHSGYTDEDYLDAGAIVLENSESVYNSSRLIVKVKEPVGEEIDWLHEGHFLFSYLHLAAEKALLKRLLDIGLVSCAFETLEANGKLPLLEPMSDIAGRLSVQTGTTLLQSHNQGKGILLGGLPAAPRGNVVIVGAGTVGMNAARVAAGLGANVTIFDLKRQQLEIARSIGPNVTALHSFSKDVGMCVANADLVIGAVLIPGAEAPKLVTEEMVKSMESGSVVVDVAIDQGGCVEGIMPTSYKEPTYVKNNVVHFAVTNMPGAVPKSASQALSAAITPYVLDLANCFGSGLNFPAHMSTGINTIHGQIADHMLDKLQ